MEKTGTPIGSYAPDFELPGTDEAVHHLARYLETFKAVGVIFMGNDCPSVSLYIDRLKQIQADFHPQGFTLIGINANDAIGYPADSFENMKAFTQSHQLNFPYLRDPTQDVARSFGAEITPQVFLIDRNGLLCYCGGIDDNAESPEAVQQPYLRNAIAGLLQGQEITTRSTPPIGCALKWRI